MASGAEPTPKPAVDAILSAFDKYKIVAIPAAHGQKDLDDFILMLVRDQRLPLIVNDIAVECGNSIYQQILDRYIAGEEVPFSEVRKVWRNTTQGLLCGTDGFYETFYPLIRAINQKLPADKRLRVLAADSPIDWDQIKTQEDLQKALGTVRRDVSISNLMEREVLSKHRKALMLFGLMHLMHTGMGFQKDYPNVTFVVSDMGLLSSQSVGRRFSTWLTPSLALAKGTWLGALNLSDLYPPPVRVVGPDCHVEHAFPKPMQKPMEDLVDAFLYLGSPDLSLVEKVPADVVLDRAYMDELHRRDALMSPGGRGIPNDSLNQQIEAAAENPIYIELQPKQPSESEVQHAVKMCLEWQKEKSTNSR